MEYRWKIGRIRNHVGGKTANGFHALEFIARMVYRFTWKIGGK